MDLLAVFEPRRRYRFDSESHGRRHHSVCVEFMDNASNRLKYSRRKLPKSDVGNHIIIQIAGDSEDVLDEQCEKIVELAEEKQRYRLLGC